jgi:hypothetical protein
MTGRIDPELTKLADAAFREASVEVIERAEAAGTAVVIWEDERIKRLTPTEARARLKRKAIKGARR